MRLANKEPDPHLPDVSKVGGKGANRRNGVKCKAN